MRRTILRWLSFGAILALTAMPMAAVSAHSSNSGANAAVKRIFVIMLENHSKSTVIGDVNAPFITSLANDYAEATNYYGVTHPSQPNYVAAITGQLDLAQMNDTFTNHFDVPNLVDQLEAKGKTWGAYMDTMPTAGYTGFTAPGSVALYTNKHNPFVLMDDIRSNPDRLANIKPYTDLAADLNSSHAPDFVWISPNQCNDMHGGVYVAVEGHPETPCPYGDTVDDVNDAALKQKADAFVESAVDTIRSSKAWTGNSAIVILTDEADFDGSATETDLWADVRGCCDSPGYGNAPGLPEGYVLIDNGAHPWSGPFGGGLVPAIVVTTHGPSGLKDATPYNHYSLLRTIEEVWGLGYLGWAADSENVSSMTTLLQH
jgi:hypothetical protein